MQNSKTTAKSLFIFVFLSFLVFSFLPDLVIAACQPGDLVQCGRDCNGNGEIDKNEQCTLCDFFALMSRVLSFILTRLAPILAGLLVVIGGVYYLAGGQNPATISTAKNILLAVAAGLVILFVAWVALNTFLTGIGVATWTGLEAGWWKFNCN
jgi:hypothetical protein